MKYISTRGGMAALEFSDILLEGLAPDGGLAVPEQLPQVSAQTLESWRGLSYADLAFEVLSLFATDIPAEDLRRLTRAAYNTQVFSSEDIVPLRPLAGGLSLLGPVRGPDAGVRGHGHAVPGPGLRIRAGQAWRHAEHPGRHFRRHWFGAATRCAASAACRCSCCRRTAA